MTKGIYIDLNNKKQVRWWNKDASKRVKVVRYDTIVETATNKPVGVLLTLKGLGKRRIVRENKKFIEKPKRLKI